MLKLFASGIAFAAFLTPAIANEYWVVLDPSTDQCSVVETGTTEATGTDESQQAATDTAEGAGADNSQPTAAATEGTTTDNSQATAVATEGTTTDNSQESATDNNIEETKTDKSRATATNSAEAQTITDTKDLLRLLGEAAESSKTPKKLRAYPTRAEAEYRMSIMRKCGIAR
jgi:hypothetical protein